MIRYRFEETIGRPSDEVWAYASDIRRHPEWMGVLDAEVLSGEPTAVGAVGRETLQLGPRRWAARITVTEARPGRRIAWRMSGGAPIAGDVGLDLEPIGPMETRVAWGGEIGLTGAWRLLEPLLAREIRAGEAAELARLKAALEAGPAPIDGAGLAAGRAAGD